MLSQLLQLKDFLLRRTALLNNQSRKETKCRITYCNSTGGLVDDPSAVKDTADEPNEDGTIVYHISVAENG